MRRLAIAFVHGVEISDPHFASTAIRLLKRAFARHVDSHAIDPEEALAIETVYWAPVLDPYESKLLERAFHPGAKGFFAKLTSLVTRINAGSETALLPFAFSTLLRSVPGVPRLDYPTLRWLVTNFLGDAVGYQITQSERRIYDLIHRVFALTLRALAAAAGEDAPLCLISHSLGTVFASNYVYDLQAEFEAGRRLIPESVRTVMRETPLETGRTLTHFYTLGSPIALWTLRYEDFGVPVRVPSASLPEYHAGLEAQGEWVNYYDKDDIIAYPLKGLSDRYRLAVTADREVSVGPWWVGWSPLAHPWYANDERVIDPIAQRLAATWMAVNR